VLSRPEPSSSAEKGSGTVAGPLRKPGTEETNRAPDGRERNNGSDMAASADPGGGPRLAEALAPNPPDRAISSKLKTVVETRRSRPRPGHFGPPVGTPFATMKQSLIRPAPRRFWNVMSPL